MEFEGLFKRFSRKEQDALRQAEVERRRSDIVQRINEHNAKLALAQQRMDRAYESLAARSDWQELMPIVRDFQYATQASSDGDWLIASIESGVSPFPAWDIVEQKRRAEREKWQSRLSNPNEPQEE